MNSRIRAALKSNSLTPEGKVTGAQSIIDGMQANGNFPASGMPITYSSLQNLINNLHNAIVAANNGTSSDTSNMHEQERILSNAFSLIKSHVEYIANLCLILPRLLYPQACRWHRKEVLTG